MAAELLPVVDLRALSQSDLDALAAASAHALSPRSCPDADPLPPLKIDRAVFNESAGSRRQTFSRLRLAAASSSPTARPASAPPSALCKDPDSSLVAYHLRCLFFPDDPALPPPPGPQTLALTWTSSSPPRSPPPDPDRETANSRGVSVDLVRLAGTEDPYGAELQRRTAGMASETELMGFIASLAGRWATKRERRKFVDASFFGDHLPRGWKLLLGLKRKGHAFWLHCFSYVSPKGSQFATCKEVSAYLMSLLGYPEAKTVTTQYNSTVNPDLCADNVHADVIGFQHQIGSSVDNPNVLPATCVTFSSYYGDLKDTDERNVDRVNAYECLECNLTFQDQISYSQHNLSSHEVTAKRRRSGKYGDPVVGKDGKFECPVCHKTYTEESRYFGHVGSHARYQGVTPGAFLNMITGKVDSNSSAELSFSLQELDHVGDAGYQYLGGPNEHGSNRSKAKDLFTANCFDGFNRPNEAWNRSADISHITYAPTACNVEVPKVNSNSIGQPDGRRDGSEVTIFNEQASSHHISRPNTFGCGNPYEGQNVDQGMGSKHGEVNNTGGSKANFLGNKNNTVAYQSVESEAYNNNSVRGFAQFSHSFTQIKPNVSSHCSLPESNTLKASNLTKGTDVCIINGSLVNRNDANCTIESFVNRHISNNESNMSMCGMTGKSRDQMQNCNDHAPGRVLQATGSSGQNVSGPMSTQANVGSRSSMVRSVGDAPMSNTTQDQCDLQLGFGVQKQQIFSGYGELRSTTTGIPLPDVPRNNSLPMEPSQFGSMTRPNSFPSGSSQFGSLDRPNAVPTSFQFGIMARPNPGTPSESSQFRSMSPDSVPHEKSTQFGSMARPNSVPPSDSTPFGSMARPSSVPHAKSSQFGSVVRTNYVPPTNSSQFGSTARSGSFPPAEASEFGNMTRQNFVSRTEPTLVLGYAPMMGNGPPVQVGWDLSSPEVTGDMMTFVCIWCNSQFHHFGPADGQQTGSFGFICPACKEKVSRHPNMRNNGSWQP